jgi:hypothetical protein
VNTNHYDITVYARAVDFRPDGETGNASFSPFSKDAKGGPHSLANWITLPSGDITVLRDSTIEIPVAINVPADAEPGGHYAAVLVGTDASQETSGGPGFSVGSLITSLFFVRIPGDVVEAGAIRDFYSENSFLSHPEANFVVRFENTGNVHLIPQGEITITNMWGKERGKIDINDQNTFGNVLPGTTRKFSFVWNGEENIFEAGRYKALATLAYGDDGRKTVYREAYFWVIPWKPVTGILLGLILFVGFIAFVVRRYVKRILEIERIRLGITQEEMNALRSQQKNAAKNADIQSSSGVAKQENLVSLKTIAAPIREELRRVADERSATEKKRASVISVLKRNQLAILTILILCVAVAIVSWYFIEVFKEERAYRIEVKHEGGKMILK